MVSKFIYKLELFFYNLFALKKAKVMDVMIDECFLQAFERYTLKRSSTLDVEITRWEPKDKNEILFFNTEKNGKYTKLNMIDDWNHYFKNRGLTVTSVQFWFSYIELVNRGYITIIEPAEKHVKLTQKGINHYVTGSSFKQRYIDNIITYASLFLSILAIAISIFS